MRVLVGAVRQGAPKGTRAGPDVIRRNLFRIRRALVLVLASVGAAGAFAQQSADGAGTTESEAASTATGTEPDAQAFPIASWSRTDALAEDLGGAAERGRAVFNNWCSACHSRDTRNAPGTRSLEFKYRGELPATIEDRTDLTAEMVAFYVRNGVATMPFYRPTEISDEDLEALGAYLVD